MGQAALAQTNHGNINGAALHRKACQKHGLIPIVGCECYFRPDRSVREKEWRYKRWHLVLLAKNLTGWHNLLKITSESFASGFYQNNCVDWELLERYHEGLICTTSCVLGPLPYLVQNGTDANVDGWVDRALGIFGDDLYFSVMPNNFDQQRQVNMSITSIAHRHGRPVIHEKDSHYPEKGWVDTQKVAVLIGMNQTFEQAEAINRERIARGEEIYELWHDGLNLSTEEEDRALYAQHHPDLPESVVDEAMESTEEVLRKIEPYLMDSTLKMPRAKGYDKGGAKTQVLQWCREGMRRIGKEGDPVYEERLSYEADVISQQNAFEMFLLVADAVRWARSEDPLPPTEDDPEPPPKRPIRLNSGRGSAAASLVCYLTKITMIDPIAHKFKFERFLNPERKSMPDIDIDIASVIPLQRGQTGRQLLKEYVVRRYGRKNVADIVAQQHFQPRAALKNVTKTLYGNLSEAFKEVSKLVSDDNGVIDPVHDTDLEKLREREPELDAFSKRYPTVWEHARRLENAGDPSVLRLSRHAGGIAILPCEVTDVIPTIRADDEDHFPRTAWAETPTLSIVDEFGIVKVDFLGLKGMDQQQMIVDMIKEHTGEEIDLDALPFMTDPYAVEPEVMRRVFHDARTLGVNQLQNDGMREFLKRAKPENIVDLAAINALYRPGPLGSGGHNRYVKRKRGEDVAELPEILKPVIGDTYSAICVAGYVMVSLGDGTQVPVRNLRDGDYVQTVDRATSTVVHRRCRGCAPTRVETGLQIVLANHDGVTVTRDHEVLTYDGMKRADSLCEGDLVAVARQIHTPPQPNPQLAPWLGTDHDVAYLLGQLTGDGCLTSVGTSLCVGDQIARDLLTEHFQKVFNGLKVSPYWHTRSWYLGLSHPALAEQLGRGNRLTKLSFLLETLGMKKKAIVKRIPEIIFRSPSAVRAAFFAGLFDADGTIHVRPDGVADRCSLTSSSPRLLRDVVGLLRMEGIPYTLYDEHLMIWDIETFFRWTNSARVVKVHEGPALNGSTVGFVPRDAVLARQQESGKNKSAFARDTEVNYSTLLPGYKASMCDSKTARKAGIELGDLLYYPVVSIETTHEQQFYGLSVEEHHNFIGNGVVLKNCFQEQVMELFEVLVGYTPGQADGIRKIIAKLYRDKGGLAKEKLHEREQEFVEAATAKIGAEMAEALWQEILPYAGYSFNRAHAGSYMAQASQDAWLKEHYPLFSYAALHTLEEKKTAALLREARAFEVATLPPDVNISGADFTPDLEANAIRFGLRGIKGIGAAAADQIMADRAERLFANFEDFEERESRKYSKVNKKAREILARVGALDGFGMRADWTSQERAEAEAELLGIALEPGGELGDDAHYIYDNVYTESEIESAEDGSSVIVGGKPAEIKLLKVKNGRQAGRQMARIKLSLDLDQYAITCFPDVWDANAELLQSGKFLMCKGRLDKNYGSITVQQIMAADEFIADLRSQELAAA